jgi:SAM-dependent methyltransferase
MAKSLASVAPRPVIAYLIDQFRQPHGPIGHLAGRIMARRGSNVERNLWMVGLLELAADHRVLEIGPGPGVALAAAAERVTAGELVAVDHSATMLRQARRRNRAGVAAGRVRLIEGSAEALPPDLGAFDRIYCMNVWQFWAEQEAVVAGLARRLTTGGILAIGLQPRAPGATAADTDAASRCLCDQLAAAGLVDCQTHRLDLRPTPATCVLGRRP